MRRIGRRGRDEERWKRSAAWSTTRSARRSTTCMRAALRTNFYQRPERPVLSIKVDSREGRGHAVAAAAVRDLRALAAARGHPPARRQGGARRHPLERPPRRLPHRGPRPDEDPDGQERDHRARRLEGRLRAEGRRAAAPGARRLPDRSLPRVRLRPARRHRQHRGRQGGAPAGGRALRRRRSRTSWSPPTRARRTSPTPPTACRRSTASGSATRSPRAAATATTTRRRASPRAAPGSASSTTSATSATTSRRSRSPWPASATCRATSSATALLRSRATKLVAAFNHAHIFIDPDPDPETSFAERERLFRLPRSTWRDYDAVAHQRGRRHLRPLGQGHPAVAARCGSCSTSRRTSAPARRSSAAS